MRFPIYKLVKRGKLWRYKPAVLDRGVPVANMVLIEGAPEFHPEGAYYVRQGRQWICVGNTPQSVMEGITKLSTPGAVVAEQPKLWQSAMGFWESYNVGKAQKTQQAMGKVLNNFLKVTKATCLREITKEDVKAYWSWEVEHSPTKSLRTAHNRTTTLGTFLKEHGIDLIGKGKNATGEPRWSIPPFDEEVPEEFEREEIDAIMKGSDARHRAAYSVMLMALFREMEAVHLCWSDVNVRAATLSVKSKPQYEWRVKKYRERVVKVPRSLIEMIDALPRTGELVFGKDGNPDGHLLRDLKKIAKTAGIDPDKVWLHKFRATGATTLLRSGMDLKDVMFLGGWRDLASVQRYLAPSQGDKLERAVEKAWATAA